MAVQVAIAAGRDAFANPSQPVSDFTNRQAYFNLLWSYYKNSVFDDISQWQKYRENNILYRNIRSIYNPTRRLVNFYVAQVYPGVLSEDASQLPDGVQLAIPLSRDTDEKLKIAIAQFWQWANWQSNNKLMVRYGGATGSCLVEIDDDVLRGKVGTIVRWPGFVAEHTLDMVGNVKSYALEYDALDGNGESFKYRKEVDKDSFRYFRDDKPYIPEGKVASEEENTYGFVPAVWCKHIDEGSDFGSPAIMGSISKIDEINGLASHVHDLIDIQIESPGIIATDGKVGRIGEDRTTSSDEYSNVSSTQERNRKKLILKAPAGTQWVPMSSNLDPSQTIGHMDRVLAEIEHDFPELSMYQELRKMSQVTGPGAARMMGDVYSRVLEVSSNYDTQSIKLFQMAVAVAGMRLKEGKDGWRNPTAQQRKFGEFDLSSYVKGQLNMAINPRPLIPMTEADSIELQKARLENAKAAEGIFNEDKRLELAGISDEAERATIINALSNTGTDS